jgi:uncharacterized iron-regulated membrane protein
MKLRTLLFWTHLTAGLIAGIVILIMSVTGTLLTFQQSILKIVERPQRFVEPPPGATRMDLDALLARVRLAVPDVEPTTVTFDSDPRATATVALGQRGNVFVNPYTGDVLGTGSARMRAFYRSVTSWHRYLSVEGERRATARAITGACNAAFLVLAITGFYLWWPRQWTWKHVSAVTVFRGGLRGKARDFNWHNVIGFWCAPVLVVLTATGMVISYTWASNLVYTMTGSPRPAPAAGRGGGPGAEGAGGRGGRGGESADRGGRGSERVGRAGRNEAQNGERSAAVRAPRAEGEGDAGPAPTLASLVARAERQVPTWRTMIVRLPPRPGGPVAFSMSDREHWNSFARSTLTLDGRTGADVRWEPYAGTSAGQKLRGWMRFAHPGELGGLTGEAVAGLASAGGGFLVWTGVALALRRLSAWRVRRRAVAERLAGETEDDLETDDARVA